MKILFVFVFFLLAAFEVPAQEIRYYKFSGREVRNTDSADFIRVIYPPESDGTLQTVQEYYINKQRKFIGMASSVDPEPVLDGQAAGFYDNGKRMSMLTYKNGKPSGTGYYYHPNSRIAKIIEFGDNSAAKVIAVYDTAGVQTVVDGNGYAKEFDENSGVEEEGQYVDGQKNGTWKGRATRANYRFEENYQAGKLTEGFSTTSEGTRYRYDELSQLPVYPLGAKGFGTFLGRNIKYPPEARDQRVTGKVVLQLTVKEDGSLEDVIVAVPVHPSLDAEARRVLRLSPDWKPGTERGIPLPFTIRMPIYFQLSGF
ncbi:MAG TPA: TonB family protein [Sphingobacteriaceae bacterium]